MRESTLNRIVMTARKGVFLLILKQKAFLREFSVTKERQQSNKEEVKAATLEFFSQLSAKLKVKEWTDWYTIPEKKVNYFGGLSVLKRFRSLFPTSNKSVSSLANALMKVYPQHPWNLQNFKDFVEVDSVKRFWQEKKNQKQFLEQLSKSLDYKNWEDWYELKVFTSHSSNRKHLDILKQGGIGLLNACKSSIVEGSIFHVIFATQTSHHVEFSRISLEALEIQRSSFYCMEGTKISQGIS